MTNFEKIRGCIMNSSLSNDDKMKMVEVFADIPDDLLIDICKLIEKDSSWVQKMNDNRKKKAEALATGNQELWKQITEEERQYLTDLTYDLD